MWNSVDLILGSSMRDDTSMITSGPYRKTLTVFPPVFVGREAMEQSDKVLLPDSTFRALSRLQVQWPLVFRVYNQRVKRAVHVGVLEFTSDEGTCVMPHWVMRNLLLKEGEVVSLENVQVPKGTWAKVQPVTKDFLDIKNPKAALEDNFRRLTALTEGQYVSLKYEGKFYDLEVVSLKPAASVSVIETDISIDFTTPLEWETKRQSAVVNEEGKERPWLSTKVLPPGGARLHNEAFDKLVVEGRVPGRSREQRDKLAANQIKRNEGK